MSESTATRSDAAGIDRRRWRYLILSILAMVMIANLQYGWSVFVLPLKKAHADWTLEEIQIAFSVFVVFETWTTPIMGALVDRIGPTNGPRIVMGLGGILVAVGWLIDAYTNSATGLWIGGALTGLGSGAVYCTAVGTAVKWFKDNRGLAVGLVAGGFGAGTALTIIPIEMVIKSSGYATAFISFGLIQGFVVLVASLFIRHPAIETAAPTTVKVEKIDGSRSYTTREMVATPIFWMLYVLDVLMCAGGLVTTANLTTISASDHVSALPIVGSVTTLSFALVFANIMNGVARPFFGWVADLIGVWQTMAIAFALGAAAYFALAFLGSQPWGFVLCVGMIFFCWGEIFSLFPAMCTDVFGTKYATTNSAVLYTAKGAAGFLVPLGTVAVAATGSWNAVLYLATGVNIVAFVLVVLVLRPASQKVHLAHA